MRDSVRSMMTKVDDDKGRQSSNSMEGLTMNFTELTNLEVG